jgi:hypothetical protein
MEIIKQGNKNLAECPDCGSILKYEPGDIFRKYEPPGMYEFDGYYNYSINCPCGTNINITSKVSSGLARKLEQIEEERNLSDMDL